MTIRFTVVFVVIISCGAWAIAQPTQLNTHFLVGKVKRVDERRSDLEFVNGVRKEKKSDLESSKVFDEQGRLTFESFTGENNTEIKHTYSKDGIRRSVGETTRPFEKPDPYKRPSLSATRFAYDAQDNSISEDRLRGRDFGDPVVEMTEYGQRFKYFFDESNRLTKTVVMGPDKSIVMSYEYFYRADGPPTDVVLSNRGRALQSIKYKYELDANGNWTKRESEARPANPNQPVSYDIVYRKITYYK